MITEIELKKIIAENLIYYRKQNGLTQLQLAEKLHYSDKAISKWERGEGIPDLYTLMEIAEILGISINNLVGTQKTISQSKNKTIHYMIPVLSVGLVWLVATCFYVIFKLFLMDLNNVWLSYIYAIPVSFIVLLIFSCIWGNNLTKFCYSSVICWSIPLSIYLSISYDRLWLLFFIAIPLQILLIFWFFFKKKMK